MQPRYPRCVQEPSARPSGQAENKACVHCAAGGGASSNMMGSAPGSRRAGGGPAAAAATVTVIAWARSGIFPCGAEGEDFCPCWPSAVVGKRPWRAACQSAREGPRASLGGLARAGMRRPAQSARAAAAPAADRIGYNCRGLV